MLQLQAVGCSGVPVQASARQCIRLQLLQCSEVQCSAQCNGAVSCCCCGSVSVTGRPPTTNTIKTLPFVFKLNLFFFFFWCLLAVGSLTHNCLSSTFAFSVSVCGFGGKYRTNSALFRCDWYHSLQKIFTQKNRIFRLLLCPAIFLPKFYHVKQEAGGTSSS